MLNIGNKFIILAKATGARKLKSSSTITNALFIDW